MTIEDKLKQLFQLRHSKDALVTQAKEIETQIDTLNAEITDEFESRQIKSMKLDGIGNFVMRVSSYPKVSDPRALNAWMVMHDVPLETITAIHANKFRAWYRELLDNKQPLPEGCENFTEAKIIFIKEA